MRIAIAGSTGILGVALAEELRAAGHEVTRLIRGAPTESDAVGWDPSYGKIDPGLLDGFGAVVNLYGTGLAGKRWSEARKQKIRESRIGPAETLARAAVEAGVPLFLNASEVAYYGNSVDPAVGEDAPAGEGFLATLCQDWENAVTKAVDGRTRLVLLRIGMLLSARGGVLGTLVPLFRRRLGGRLGTGRQYVSWISARDAAAAIAYLIDDAAAAEVSGPVNLAAPEPVTNRALTTELGRVLHRPAGLAFPAFLLRAALGEYADAELLASRRVSPTVLTEHGFRFAHPTVDLALAEAFSPARPTQPASPTAG